MAVRKPPPELPLGCIKASSVVVRRDPVASIHLHSHHEFILPLSGSHRMVLGTGLSVFGPGQALMLPAGTQHRPCPEEKGNIHLLIVQWRGIDMGPLSVPEGGLRTDACCRLLQIGHWLLDLGADVSDRAQQYRSHLLWLLLAEWQRLGQQGTMAEAASVPAMDRITTSALTIMRDNSRHPWSLDELGRHFGMSPTRLGQLIRRQTGIPMSEHLRRFRLDRALTLIRQTRLPLQIIAEQVGYRSAFHLSALVTKRLGCSPQWLRRHMP